MMRRESSVDLGAIKLTGSGNQRKLVLDVTVDGSDASALGVMSQGELHALGLSLFLPRATVSGSPFGFVMIDDPVQAMDPAKVDGLAQVLAEVARTRQVVVFSHDDRLADAVRRLPLPPTVWEVQRHEQPEVRLVPSADPVARYLDDVRAVLRDRTCPRSCVARSWRPAAAVRSKRPPTRRSAPLDSGAASGTRSSRTRCGLPTPRTRRSPWPSSTSSLDSTGRGGGRPTLSARASRGAHAGGYAGDLTTLVEDAGRLAARISR